jgi:cation diffusion facilitator CzcD-associated flavoprotein CzcO
MASQEVALVVGAGVSGLQVARALQHSGMKVRRKCCTENEPELQWIDFRATP